MQQQKPGPIYWSEQATADQLKAGSTALLRQELARLHTAVEQLDDQLRDPERPKRFPGEAEYRAWVGKAYQARMHKATTISRVQAVLDGRGEPIESLAEARGKELATAAHIAVRLLRTVRWSSPSDDDIITAIDRLQVAANRLTH